MLRATKSERSRAVRNAQFAIVASEYNNLYVDAMVGAAQDVLKRAGAKDVLVVRVPGAFEIPVVAARLARQAQEAGAERTEGRGQRTGTREGARSLDARHSETTFVVICLGVILRGETTHAAHIGESVSRALMEIQMRYEVPVIHEVLLLENEEQARVRCLGRKHNRGAEAAQTALVMAQVMRTLACL